MKRRNGESTVEQLPSGRWRVRGTVNGKRTTLGIYDTEDQANEGAESFARLRKIGGVEGNLSRTLATFGEEWLDQREVNGSAARTKVRSIRVERSAWRTHVAGSELGKKRLAAITIADVEAWTLWLRSRPATHAITFGAGTPNRKVHLKKLDRTISKSSQKHALRLVRSALAFAVRKGLIKTNPATGISIAPGGRPEKDLSDDWLRHEEIGRLLLFTGISLRLRAAYAAAIGLALRLADLKALEIKNVHLDAQVPGPHVRVWLEKPEKWHRVPVLPWLVPILRAHLAKLPKRARFVFPADDGEHYRTSYDFQWASRKKIRRGALERAGISRRIRFHDLRGTTATHLALGTWGRRWSLHEIQAMLAHSDQRVTERYVRRAIDMLAEAARQTTGGVVHALSTPIAESPTPPGGIEPPTFRLEGAIGPEQSREVSSPRGRTVDDVAREVVENARAIPRELVEELIAAILGREEYSLALKMLDTPGGRFETRNALRLARLVLEPSGTITSISEASS